MDGNGELGAAGLTFDGGAILFDGEVVLAQDIGDGIHVGIEFVIQVADVAFQHDVGLHFAQIAFHFGRILAIEVHIAVVQDVLHIAGEDSMAIQMDDHVVLIANAQQIPGFLRGYDGQGLAFGVVPAFGGNTGNDDHVTIGIGNQSGQHVLINGDLFHAGDLGKVAAEPIGFAALQVAQGLVGGVIDPVGGATNHGQVIFLALVVGTIVGQTAGAGAGGDGHLDAGFVSSGNGSALTIAGHAANQAVFEVDAQFLVSASFQSIDDLGYAPGPAHQGAVLGLVIIAVGIQLIESAGAIEAIGSNSGGIIGNAGIAAFGSEGLVAGGTRVPFHAPEVHLVAGIFHEVGIAAFGHGVLFGIRQGEQHVELGGLAVNFNLDFQDLAVGIVSIVIILLNSVGQGFLGLIGHIAIHIVAIQIQDFFPAGFPIGSGFNLGAILESHQLGQAGDFGQRFGVGLAAAVVQLLESGVDGVLGIIQLLLSINTGGQQGLGIGQGLIHDFAIGVNIQIAGFHILDVVHQSEGAGRSNVGILLAIQLQIAEQAGILIGVAGGIEHGGSAAAVTAGALVDLEVKAQHGAVGGSGSNPHANGFNDVADGVAFFIVADGGLGVPVVAVATVGGALVIEVYAIVSVVIPVGGSLVIELVNEHFNTILHIDSRAGLIQVGVVDHSQNVQAVVIPYHLEFTGAHGIGGSFGPDSVGSVAIQIGGAVHGIYHAISGKAEGHAAQHADDHGENQQQRDLLHDFPFLSFF